MSVTLNDIKAKFDPQNLFWDKAIQYLIDSGLYSDPLLDAPYADGSLPAVSGGIRIYTNGTSAGAKGVALDVILAALTSAIGNTLSVSGSMPDGASNVGFYDTTAYSWLNSGSVHSAIVNLADRINSIVISGGGGSGTVTSVGLSAYPDVFSVSNTPITDSGDIVLDLQNQTSGTVFAGPIAGSSSKPSFRALSASDLPSGIDASKVGSGNISNTEFDYLNGTSANIQNQFNTLTNNLSTSSSNLQNQITNTTNSLSGYASSNSLSAYLPLSGGNLTGQLNGTNISATGNVSASDLFITSNKSSATFFAGPIAGSGSQPSFRAISASDIPSGIDASKIGSGNIDNTEFDYLNGTSANIQNQLNSLVNYDSFLLGNFNNYLPLSGGTLTGQLNGTNISASGNVSATGVFADHIDFDPTYVGTYKEGRLFYDDQNKTLTLYTDTSSSSLQLGRENWVRVRNRTGSTLTDGTVVYVSSAVGQTPTVNPAIATSEATSMTLGIVTHHIEDNAFGEVVSFGLINNIDTSMFTDGDMLWLSPLSAGKLVNTKPSAPYYAVHVGVVVHAHNTQGKILVHPDTYAHLGLGGSNQLLGMNSSGTGSEYKSVSGISGQISVQHSANNIVLGVEYTSANREPTGFVDRTSSTLSFTSASRQFTITGNFEIYIAGRKYSKTTESITITSAAGNHFIYYNTSGTMVETQTPWNLLTDVPIALVYWTSAGNLLLAEERHGLQMDSATHYYLHHTFGTRYLSGFGGTYTLNSETSAGFGLTQGTIADEDITMTITNGSVNGNFRQPISYPGSFPVYYRTGTDGVNGNWRRDSATTFPFKNNSAGSRVNYNQLSGGSWVQTEAPNNDYVAYFIYATDDINEPVISVQGQRTDSTLADSQNNNTPLTFSLGDFPFQEAKLLYRIIVRTNNTYTGNDYRVRINDVLDYRNSLTSVQATAGGTGTVTSVAMTVPTSILSVSGTPITNAGSLDVSLVNQTSATVFAGPISGSASQPSFRSLSASDVPSGIDAAKIGSGSVSNAEFGYLDGTSAAIQTQLNTLTTNLSTSSSNLQNQITNTTNSLSAYLPLSGGTLTGTLTGTNGVFSSVSAVSLSASTIVSSSLTNGRVAIVGTNGVLQDDAGLTWSRLSGITRYLFLGDGSVSGTVAYVANGAPGYRKVTSYQTSSVARWVAGADSSTESGTNAGSSYIIEALSDAGGVIDVPLTILRAAGGPITLSRPLLVSAAIASSTLTNGRVAIIGSNGILQDNNGLTYASNVLTVGTSSSSAASILVDSANASNKDIWFSTSGSLRWVVRCDNTSESGSDIGSNFQLIARNDAGAIIDVPFTVNRVSAAQITLGGTTNRPTNFTGNILLAGTTRITSAGAATFASTTITGLSANRIPTIGTGGLLQSDAGLTIVQASGITVTQILGDGLAASNVALALRAPAARRRILGFQTSSTDRWVVGADSSSESGSNAGSSFIIEAYTDAGSLVDTPVSIVRAASGPITLSRPLLVSAAIASSTLTNGRIALITSSGVITDSADHLWGTGSAGLTLGRGSGSNARYLVFDHGASNIHGLIWKEAGVDRWILSNTGTVHDIALEALDTSGVTIDQPIKIVRAASGPITFSRPLLVSAAIASSTLTNGRITYATTAGLLTDSSALTWDNAQLTLKAGAGTGAVFLGVNGGAGNIRDIYWQTSGVSRWTMRANNVAESGGNAGSNFEFIARDDSGVLIDNPITIVRSASGPITLSRPLLVSAAIASSTLTNARIPTIGASGVIQTDAGLTYTQTGGVTRLLIVGDGSVADVVGFAADAPSDRDSVLSLRSAGTSRWGVVRNATTLNFSIIARDASGVDIDSPITIANTSAGDITIGGSTSRRILMSGPVELDSQLRYMVTDRSGSASTGATDLVIRYTGTGGHTETLPAATGTGRILILKHVGSSGVLWTIARTASDTIEGEPSIVLDTSSSVTLIDAASGLWEILG